MNEKIRIKSFKVTSVAAPTQIEGKLSNGNEFYIRYRNGNYFYCDDDNKFTLNPHNEEEDYMDIDKALSIAGLVYLSEEE